MKKKKFLALLLTGAMALAALTGCSSSTRPTRSRSASPRAHRRRPMSWVWS